MAEVRQSKADDIADLFDDEINVIEKAVLKKLIDYIKDNFPIEGGRIVQDEGNTMLIAAIKKRA